MRGPTLWLSLSIVAITILVALLQWLGTEPSASDRGRVLTVYCAAGIKPPVVAAAKEYEQRYGVRVDFNYGGSGTLLSQLDVAREGDLYIAGDESYVARAQTRGLVDESIGLAEMRPVVATRKDSKLHIRDVRDLLRDDVAVGLANPDAAAIGKLTKHALRSIWSELEKKTKVFKPTVSELANDLVIGAIDAAVIWDATANQYDELEGESLGPLALTHKRVTAGILRSSTRPTTTLRFARFLSARDEGQLDFEDHGYTPVGQDTWAETPELLLMSGAMLNRAIDDSVRDFEKREGVRITRIYDGCGLLVAQMEAGARPDAFFACDTSFLDPVQALFDQGWVFARNDIVMLTPRDSKVEKLDDLLGDGLRVGLGHPDKSALGALTAKLIAREGLSDRLRLSGNVVVESATGDLLVNQARAGSLDVALVYRSNAFGVLDTMRVVDIDDIHAQAAQPLAVAKDSDYPALAGRLRLALERAESKARFEALGFDWQR